MMFSVFVSLVAGLAAAFRAKAAESVLISSLKGLRFIDFITLSPRTCLEIVRVQFEMLTDSLEVGLLVTVLDTFQQLLVADGLA